MVPIHCSQGEVHTSNSDFTMNELVICLYDMNIEFYMFMLEKPYLAPAQQYYSYVPNSTLSNSLHNSGRMLSSNSMFYNIYEPPSFSFINLFISLYLYSVLKPLTFLAMSCIYEIIGKGDYARYLIMIDPILLCIRMSPAS